MPHECILVVGENVEDQLMEWGYWNEPNPEDLIYVDVEDELQADANHVITEDDYEYRTHVRYSNEEISLKYNERYKNNPLNKTRLEFHGGGDFEKFAKSWLGGCYVRHPETNRACEAYNPKNKCEGFEIGGFFMLKAKENANFDVCEDRRYYDYNSLYGFSFLKKDIDFDAMWRESKEENIQKYHELREEIDSLTDVRDIERLEFWCDINDDDTEETFVERHALTSLPVSKILCNGVFYEADRWDPHLKTFVEHEDWNTFVQEFVDSLDGDALMTIVDFNV